MVQQDDKASSKVKHHMMKDGQETQPPRPFELLFQSSKYSITRGEQRWVYVCIGRKRAVSAAIGQKIPKKLGNFKDLCIFIDKATNKPRMSVTRQPQLFQIQSSIMLQKMPCLMMIAKG
uniref:Uncharacterized protein n=1 Tax=Sphaerodactylus townsendi TaxID=933632 RepID=A0ACB8G5Z2_9SAUR